MPFDPFLNRDAVRLADDAFYAAHPEFHRSNGSRKARMWCIGRNKTLRSEWYSYYRNAKSELRPPATIDAADTVDPVAALIPCAQDAIAPFCTPIRNVELTSVSYVNKFLLYDEEKKWTYSGLPYTPLDWTPNMENPNPIVVHFDDKHAYSADITYRIKDDDACPETGNIQAIYEKNNETKDADPTVKREPEWHHSHLPLNDTELSPGKEHKGHFRGVHYPPAKIAMNEAYGTRWQAIIPGKKYYEMGQPKNEVYFTWGKPKTGVHPEDGATIKRMRESVRLASQAKSVDEFEVIKHLFGFFPGYTLGLDHLPSVLREKLEKDKNLLKKLNEAGWPSYFTENQTEKAGAWMAMEEPGYMAECQAICRLMQAIMRQLGAESTINFRTYTADYSDPTRALEAPEAKGPDPQRQYAMVDLPVEVGKTYGVKSDVGFNNFEAYLEVQCPGMEKPRLFGGGIGLIAEGRSPIACFKGIAEFKVVKRLLKTGEGDKRSWQWTRLITGFHQYEANSFADWNGNLA